MPTPTNGSTVVRTDFPALMAKSLKLIFDENTQNLKEELFDLIHQETMEGAYDIELGQVGLGSPSINAELEGPRYDAPKQGRGVIYIATKYAQGVRISFEAKEDDQFGKIANSIVPDLTAAFKVERNQQLADLFNNAFVFQGYEPDGKSLVATDHPSIRGPVRSNRLTLPLSIAGLQQARLRFRQYLTESGKKMPLIGRHIICGQSDESLAMELTRSTNKPGQGFTTQPNDINTEKDQWTVHVANYLTDDTRWFALTDKAEHKLKWKDRKKLYRKTVIDEENESVALIARARWVVGFSEWCGVVGYLPG